MERKYRIKTQVYQVYARIYMKYRRINMKDEIGLGMSKSMKQKLDGILYFECETFFKFWKTFISNNSLKFGAQLMKEKPKI